MKYRYGRLDGLLWAVIGIAICVESRRIDIGSLPTPGPGLIPLGCGLLLLILGIALYISDIKQISKIKEVIAVQGIKWKRIIFVPLSIILYALIIEFSGFLLITPIWIGLNCRLGKMKWRTTVFMSIVTSFSSYVLFKYFLGLRFPIGIFGF